MVKFFGSLKFFAMNDALSASYNKCPILIPCITSSWNWSTNVTMSCLRLELHHQFPLQSVSGQALHLAESSRDIGHITSARDSGHKICIGTLGMIVPSKSRYSAVFFCCNFGMKYWSLKAAPSALKVLGHVNPLCSSNQI